MRVEPIRVSRELLEILDELGVTHREVKHQLYLMKVSPAPLPVVQESILEWLEKEEAKCTT